MKLNFTRSAKNDLKETLAFIDRQGPRRGAKFRAELRRCIEQIQATPESWPRVFLDVRMRIMKQFKFGLYYQVFEEQDTILVGAIVHLKRQGRFLKRRFKKKKGPQGPP